MRLKIRLVFGDAFQHGASFFDFFVEFGKKEFVDLHGFLRDNDYKLPAVDFDRNLAPPVMKASRV
jgi:hypothetical protein